MNKIDIINAARGRLLTSGWCQGRYIDDEGRNCIYGALHRSATSGDSAILNSIMEDLRGITVDIVAWNDMPGRTFNEVLDLLDELAIRVKKEEMEGVCD